MQVKNELPNLWARFWPDGAFSSASDERFSQHQTLYIPAERIRELVEKWRARLMKVDNRTADAMHDELEELLGAGPK